MMNPVGEDGGLYAGYESWKNWTDLFRVDADASDYFERECSGLKIVGADVLEIGFGAGSFVAWSKAKGARVGGTEVIPALITEAEKFGIDVLPEDLATIDDRHRGRFDTVVAFDVFEHFSLAQISDRLASIETMLKPGGRLLLRFPNPQSPFGLAPQFGDPTHRTALSLGVFERLIHGSAFEVVRYSGAARAPGRGVVKRCVRFLRYSIQSLISMLLNAIYAQRIPWDPVVVLVLRKTERSESGGPLIELTQGRS